MTPPDVWTSEACFDIYRERDGAYTLRQAFPSGPRRVDLRVSFPSLLPPSLPPAEARYVAVSAERLAAMERAVEAAADALRRMLAVQDALMPGVRHIAVQNYVELNDAPIAARAALAAAKAAKEKR